MAWSSSNRRATLPKNWGTIRARVKDRAGSRCEARIHHPDCDGIGRECDHIGDRLDHSLANLQWLSPACHRAKTQSEAKQAKANRSRKRQPTKHPGTQGVTPPARPS